MEVTTMGRQPITSHSALHAIGVAGIVGFVALALCCDANVLKSLHIMNKVKAEESLIGGLGGKFHPSLGDEGTIPDLNATLSDSDGNGWLLQEVTTRLPGRIDTGETTFASVADLASTLRRAEAAHGAHEKLIGAADANWPDWYAAYMVAEQAGTELPK
jgi:hypothetical protein